MRIILPMFSEQFILLHLYMVTAWKFWDAHVDEVIQVHTSARFNLFTENTLFDFQHVSMKILISEDTLLC